MSIPHDVKKLWQFIAGSQNTGSVDLIARRFLQVFLDHGIEASQIPRLLPQIKLDNLQHLEKLLAVLTPAILDQTADLFGIRSPWLEGVDDEIYESRHCYKEPTLLLNHLATLKIDTHHPFSFPLRILTTTKNLDYHNTSDQLLAPVIVEPIMELGDKWIYRYHIYRDGFNWNYEPTRIQLKVIARIVYKHFNTSVPMFVISMKEMEEILAGKLIPRRYLNRGLNTDPSLEDYCESIDNSVVAKEIDELPALLDYIKEHNLLNYSFDRINVQQPPVEPIVTPDSVMNEEPSIESNNPIQIPGDIAELVISSVADNNQPIVPTVRSNASKAGMAKNASINQIKQQFISFYENEGKNFLYKKAAATHFFELLHDTKEKLLFVNQEAATRTLLTALRDHIKLSK